MKEDEKGFKAKASMADRGQKNNSTGEKDFDALPIAQYGELTEKLPCTAFFVKNDSSLSLLYGNAQFYEMLAYTKDELQYRFGNRIGAIMDQESLQKLNQMITKDSFATGKKFWLEQKFKKKNGEPLFIKTYATCLKYRGIEVFLCLAFNNVEGKKREQQEKNSKYLIQFVTKCMELEVFIYEMETRKAEVLIHQCFLEQGHLEQIQNGKYFEDAVISSGLVHPNYTDIFLSAFQNLRQNGKETACEIMMKQTDGRYAWVRLSIGQGYSNWQGKKIAVGLLENISKEKDVALKYVSETQYYQAILSEKDAYGHVDVTEDRITRVGGIWKLYNELIDKVSYGQLIEEFIRKVVHPEERTRYLEMMQRENFLKSFSSGNNRFRLEFRRIVEQNKMVWMEITVHLFQSPFSKHIMALLYLQDIDTQKKRELMLLHNSERDYLTNTYNRKIAEMRISYEMERAAAGDTGVFLLWDIDKLKIVNNKYGYSAGDAMLKKVADILAVGFPKNGIIGRFGGDEFILYAKDAGSVEQVETMVSSLYSAMKQEIGPNFSSSIGIVMIEGTRGYHAVFQEGDTALTEAKNAGGNRFAFYQGQKLIGVLGQDSTEKEGAAYMDSESMGHYNIQEQSEREIQDFDNFVGEKGDMAYLVDPVTFELVCGNQAFYDRIGKTKLECTGLKCYEAVQQRETPCPFCAKANWTTDKFYIWRNLNAALEQEFLIKNKLVQWGGREMLLALAVDISNDKSIVDSLENSATESHMILSGISSMSEAENLGMAMKTALETVGSFFRAESVYFWMRKKSKMEFKRLYHWTRNHQDIKKKMPQSRETAVNAWLSSWNWREPAILESPEAMLCYSFALYQYMMESEVSNAGWFPVWDGKELLGFIEVESMAANYQNHSFVESFSTFIVNELKKRGLYESLLYRSSHDAMTNLQSRSSYEKFVQGYDADLYSEVGVIIANLDGLKGINNSKGFQTGDYYIVQFANILKRIFYQHAIYRLNGDEFLVIALNITDEKLNEQLERLTKSMAKETRFSVSIGHAWDNVEKALDILIENATQTMKINKKRHHDSCYISTDLERRNMLRELCASIENKEFVVYLQPKVIIETGQIIGAEALVRYIHKEYGMIPPGKFIPLLEQNNLIRYVDLFVLEEICKLQEKWKKEGVECPVISLNFSRATLSEAELEKTVQGLLSGYAVEKHLLEIEITESFAEAGKSVLYQAVHSLYEAGFSISLDDFGTKYTNLSILADIDFDVLKIDKSLIHTMSSQKRNQVILKNIIAMCNDLNVRVVAEGVETKEQDSILRNLGCHFGQGYLYGKPMDVADFEREYFDKG